MGEKMSLASMEKRFFEREDISNQNFDLNYCIPINVGVISQTLVEQSYDQKAVEKALKMFGKKMKSLFGRFSGRRTKNRKRNDSRNQLNLLVLENDNSKLTRIAVDYLTKNCNATEVKVKDFDELKKKSWMILALWDGIPNGIAFDRIKKVLFYNVGSRTARSTEYNLSLPEIYPVFQIVLPVTTKDDSFAKAEKSIKNYSLREIYPRYLDHMDDNSGIWFSRYCFKSDKQNKEIKRNFEKNARKIKQFNRVVLKYVSNNYKQTSDIWDPLDKHRTSGLPLSVSAETALLRLTCYDAISMREQKKYVSQLKWVMGLAGLGLFCFSFYSDLYALKPFAYLFLAFFVIAYLYFFLIVKRTGSYLYYLEFRSLAEGMRVQCHWYTAGISETSGNYYNIKCSKDMSWGKYAINRWNETDTFAGRFNGRINYDLVCDEWLVDQKNFFEKKIKEKNSAKYVRIGNIFTIGWVIFAVLLGISVWKGFSYENYLIFFLGILNIATIAVSYFTEKRLYKVLVSRYTYCKLLAEKAIVDYQSARKSANQNPKLVQEIFINYGKEALEENAEWLMIQNDREPDVPNG